MRKPYISIFFTLLFFCILIAVPRLLPAEEKHTGHLAPSWGKTQWINLPKGKTSLDIADYRGKVVYLAFFQQWWPGCRKYGFPALQEIADHYKNDDKVGVVAIQTTFEGFSVNSYQVLPEVAKEYGLTIPIGQNGWRGKPSSLMYRYKTRGTPWIVIIDGNGIIRRSDFHYTVNESIQTIDYLKNELGKSAFN